MFLNPPDQPYKASIFTLLFQWQRSAAIWFISTSLITVLIAQCETYHYLPAKTISNLSVPTFILGVLGGALGIFVSFRTNSAYQRWWEGRKLWGRLINTSRHLCTQAIHYLPRAQAERVVHQHIAYVHALRCGLRDEDLQTDEHFVRVLDEETRLQLKGQTNVNHAILNLQFAIMIEARKREEISEFFMSDLDESIRHLLDIQGGTERIKKTPFPPIYGHIASRMTQLYALLLPFCIVGQLGWFTIPATLLICMTFQLINEVGRVLENPLMNNWPALALSAMSLTIERNLRQALQETELPDAQSALQLRGIQVMM